MTTFLFFVCLEARARGEGVPVSSLHPYPAVNNSRRRWALATALERGEWWEQ